MKRSNQYWSPENPPHETLWSVLSWKPSHSYQHFRYQEGFFACGGGTSVFRSKTGKAGIFTDLTNNKLIQTIWIIQEYMACGQIVLEDARSVLLWLSCWEKVSLRCRRKIDKITPLQPAFWEGEQNNWEPIARFLFGPSLARSAECSFTRLIQWGTISVWSMICK